MMLAVAGIPDGDSAVDDRSPGAHPRGMRPSRTWQAILDGNRSLRFAAFERLLRAFGFVLDRQSGSHRIWLHPTARARMNVQPKGGQAKHYQIRQLVELVEIHGLELRD